jgi:phage terminase small subunit
MSAEDTARVAAQLDDFEREALAQSCNEKERAFVREYVTDLNGTSAVWRCGCFNVTTDASAAVAASRLLSRVKVQSLIAVTQAQRAMASAITQESVLSEMQLLSHSDISNYIVDDDGNVKLVAGAPEGAMRAVQSIKRKKTVKEDKEGTLTITYDVELKLWDKPAPLKLMGRHKGLFPDKVEVSGPNGGPIDTVTRIERVIIDAKP